MSHDKIKKIPGTVPEMLCLPVSAEEKVRESEARFRAIFDHSADGIIVAHAVSKDIVMANRAMCTKLLCSQKEICARTIANLYPKNATPEVLDELHTIQADTRVVSRNVPVLRNDGTTFYADIAWSSFLAHDGTGYVIAVFNDVTDRKAHEEQLSAITDRLTLATQSANIGIWDYDVTTGIFAWDQQMYALFGEMPDTPDPVTSIMERRIHPHDIVRVQKEMERAIRTKRNFDTAFRVSWNGGALHDIHFFGRVRCDTAGKPVMMIGVSLDITKEKEIDRAKTEFVSLASHQLRTPLTAINWYAEMLLSGDAGTLTDEQKQYVQEMYRGNLRMVELVNALLNVSRIELGTFAVEPEPLHLSHVAESVIKEIRSHITDKKQTVQMLCAPDVPEIPADQKLTRIIFQNILTNAVKYTPDGGTIRVNIAMKQKGSVVATHTLNKDSILITIADSGYGIPKAQYDKVFTKLFRADNVRSKDTDGTGLGLYLVKSVVDHVDGRIWFESEENIGTTFYIALPATGMKRKEGSKELAEETDLKRPQI